MRWNIQNIISRREEPNKYDKTLREENKRLLGDIALDHTDYFLILEMETDDPAIQNFLDIEFGVKEDFEDLMFTDAWETCDKEKWKADADYFDKGYEKYSNTVVKDLCTKVICADKTKTYDGGDALARLAWKLLDHNYHAEATGACKIREKHIGANIARYFCFFEVRLPEGPQIRSLMEYFCGEKEDESQYLGSNAFQEEYEKLTNETMGRIFRLGNECGVASGGDIDDKTSLDQLGTKLADRVRRYYHRWGPIEQEPPEIQRIFAT